MQPVPAGHGGDNGGHDAAEGEGGDGRHLDEAGCEDHLSEGDEETLHLKLPETVEKERQQKISRMKADTRAANAAAKNPGSTADNNIFLSAATDLASAEAAEAAGAGGRVRAQALPAGAHVAYTFAKEQTANEYLQSRLLPTPDTGFRILHHPLLHEPPRHEVRRYHELRGEHARDRLQQDAEVRRRLGNVAADKILVRGKPMNLWQELQFAWNMPFLNFTTEHRTDWTQWHVRRLAPTGEREDTNACLFFDLPTKWAATHAEDSDGEAKDGELVRESQYGDLTGQMGLKQLADNDSETEEIDDMVLATDIPATRTDQAVQQLDAEVAKQWKALMLRTGDQPRPIDKNTMVLLRNEPGGVPPLNCPAAAWSMPVWLAKVTKNWRVTRDAADDTNLVDVIFYYQKAGDINGKWTQGRENVPGKNAPAWTGQVDRRSVLHSDGITLKKNQLSPDAKNLHLAQYWNGPYVRKKRARHSLMLRANWVGWPDWHAKYERHMELLLSR